MTTNTASSHHNTGNQGYEYNKNNQQVCHTTRTGQQGTTVQDPGGTTTSITVQRQDQARRPSSKRRICKCLQQIPPQKGKS